MTGWTNDDFVVLYSFLRDVRCLLDDKDLYMECRELLKSECEEASRRLSRIVDALGVYA